MDSLAREPDKLTTPHNIDTGETILHLLAKVRPRLSINTDIYLFHSIEFYDLKFTFSLHRTGFKKYLNHTNIEYIFDACGFFMVI